MKAEELRIAIRNVLEQGVISTLSKYGYSWNKSKMCFHRKVGDFKQTILINSSVNPRFTNGIGYISIHLFYNSPKVEKMASVLIDAKTDFAKVKNVLNINSGFISGKGAVSFDLLSLDDLLNVFNLDNMPFKEILSFLNERTTIQDILMDFENNKGVKILQRFSNNRVTPINSTKFSKFFRWLGASVSKVSTDNSFRLDVSELDSWEEI